MRCSPLPDRLVSVALGAAGLCYPFAVLLGLRLLPPGLLLAVPAVLLALRVALGRRGATEWVLGLATILAGLLLLVSPALAVRAWPVLVSLGFAVLFAASLRWPPVMIERFARLADPDLPDSARPYLRRVTQAWLLFFLANAAIAAWTVLYGSLAAWTFYNGFLSYVLIGAMFGGEWLVRRHVRAGQPG